VAMNPFCASFLLSTFTRRLQSCTVSHIFSGRLCVWVSLSDPALVQNSSFKAVKTGDEMCARCFFCNVVPMEYSVAHSSSGFPFTFNPAT